MLKVPNPLNLLFNMWTRVLSVHKISKQTHTLLVIMITGAIIVIAFFLAAVLATAILVQLF
jgi:Na+-translocating ferredoxin:NAD+ oxidoreductase RnfE subunit